MLAAHYADVGAPAAFRVGEFARAGPGRGEVRGCAGASGGTPTDR